MRNMPALNSASHFRTSTAEPDFSSASLPGPGAFISAPDDVPGIRRTTPPPRRWPPTNISPTGFSNAPAFLTLGGEYFFLHDRHRAHRPAGHERDDALEYFRRLGGTAFVKPLQGSRGDFAQAVHGEASLLRYLGEVSQYYDAILIQPIVSGIEYRVFLLDDEVVYSARKYPPFVSGDGVRTIRDLLAAHNDALRSRGLSPVSTEDSDTALDAVLPKGERFDIPGRMNLSAGGTMVLEAPHSRGRVRPGEEGRPGAWPSRCRRRHVH